MKTQPQRPNCKICNTGVGEWNYKAKDGIVHYRSICKSCRIKNDPSGYHIHKKNNCEKCGFIPTHRCQLDVDHIDGNHNNNSPDNLQTLCANCHRLKTYESKDNKQFPVILLEI